jgi:alpha-methylacyl-CoA racemase
MGQIVDAAMLDGVNALMSAFHGLQALGLHNDGPGSVFLGGAAHFYDTYETRDGKYVSIAAIEPRFYEALIERAGLDRDTFAPHAFNWSADEDTRTRWRELQAVLAKVFKSKTRDEWCVLLEGTDACFAPVLTLSEAPAHKHNTTRNAFLDVGGYLQAAPAPRFSRTRNGHPRPGVEPGTNSREILSAAGFSRSEIESLLASGAVFQKS